MDLQSTKKPLSLIRRTANTCGAVCYDCRFFERVLPAAFLAGIAIALGYLAAFAAPGTFPAPTIFHVRDGATLSEVSQDLQLSGMVRYARVFELTARAMGGNRRMHAGAYFFPTAQDAITIALRLRDADYELDPVRITVPESATVKDIAGILGKKLAPFNTDGFMALAQSREGYLYPDTYFFFPGQDPAVVVRAMEENFKKRMMPLEEKIRNFGKPLNDVITMASIVEREAYIYRDRRTIAGVLWQRLKIGMPLQVDATFSYVLDKSLTQLTLKDLRTDSPYNTYLNKGLPPTPIGSPSSAAIESVVTPIKTPYLYYLSDRYGVTHYSATYAEHLRKKNLYIGS